jgi:hypothetical protein
MQRLHRLPSHSLPSGTAARSWPRLAADDFDIVRDLKRITPHNLGDRPAVAKRWVIDHEY